MKPMGLFLSPCPLSYDFPAHSDTQQSIPQRVQDSSRPDRQRTESQDTAWLSPKIAQSLLQYICR